MNIIGLKKNLTVQTENKLKRQICLKFHNVSVLLLTVRQVFQLPPFPLKP